MNGFYLVVRWEIWKVSQDFVCFCAGAYSLHLRVVQNQLSNVSAQSIFSLYESSAKSERNQLEKCIIYVKSFLEIFPFLPSCRSMSFLEASGNLSFLPFAEICLIFTGSFLEIFPCSCRSFLLSLFWNRNMLQSVLYCVFQWSLAWKLHMGISKSWECFYQMRMQSNPCIQFLIQFETADNSGHSLYWVGIPVFFRMCFFATCKCDEC